MPAFDLLTTHRHALGLTQQAVAGAARVSVPTLRGLERGEGSLRSLGAVLPVLGLEWTWGTSDAGPGAVLAERRRARGITQSALALRVGCSRPTVIALERDFTGSVATLRRVLSVLGLRRPLRIAGASARGLVPARNAPDRDRVMTPPDLAAQVLAHFEGRMTGRVLDPARGDGAFFDRFPDRLARDWCELAQGRDFLDWRVPIDWIVTNPPWSQIRAFTRHAMTLAEHIVWLAPLVNLTTKARLRDLDQHGFGIAELVLIDTPRGWPQSGFQLVAAHMVRGHVGGWTISRLGSGPESG